MQLNTDWTQVEVITLVNDGTGLGFGIIGGKSTGVVVKTILPGGVADRVNLLPLLPLLMPGTTVMMNFPVWPLKFAVLFPKMCKSNCWHQEWHLVKIAALSQNQAQSLQTLVETLAQWWNQSYCKYSHSNDCQLSYIIYQKMVMVSCLRWSFHFCSLVRK